MLPLRAVRAERPMRVGIAFLALREDGCVLLRRRVEAGLLGGMLEVPSTGWDDLMPPARDALKAAPLKADWWQVPGTVVHTFTHFKLELVVYRALVPVNATLTFWAEPERCRWVDAPRSCIVSAAERHAQGDRARPQGAVSGRSQAETTSASRVVRFLL